MYDLNLLQWLWNEVFLGNQQCQFGVSIQHFRDCFHLRQGLMWWVSHLHIVFIPQSILSAVPLHTTEGTVGGVRWPVITIHVVCHWPFLKIFLMALHCFIKLVASYHRQPTGHLVSLLSDWGAARSKRAVPLIGSWWNYSLMYGINQWFSNTDFPWPCLNVTIMLCGHIT
jgi:hypothetical protein